MFTGTLRFHRYTQRLVRYTTLHAKWWHIAMQVFFWIRAEEWPSAIIWKHLCNVCTCRTQKPSYKQFMKNDMKCDVIESDPLKLCGVAVDRFMVNMFCVHEMLSKSICYSFNKKKENNVARQHCSRTMSFSRCDSLLGWRAFSLARNELIGFALTRARFHSINVFFFSNIINNLPRSIRTYSTGCDSMSIDKTAIKTISLILKQTTLFR